MKSIVLLFLLALIIPLVGIIAIPYASAQDLVKIDELHPVWHLQASNFEACGEFYTARVVDATLQRCTNKRVRSFKIIFDDGMMCRGFATLTENIRIECGGDSSYYAITHNIGSYPTVFWHHLSIPEASATK